MKPTQWLRPALIGTVLPFAFTFSACSGSEDSPNSTGDGDGSPSDGGAPVTGGTAGVGGSGTGGGSCGTPSGTGGAVDGRVPGTDSYNCDAAEGAPGTLSKTEIGSGFLRPIYVTHAPNDPRLFVIEQEGIIKISDGGTFMDITDRVLGPVDTANPWDERGLLGLAFHPDYATNGLFYVFYSADPGGASVLSEFSVSAADANAGDSATERILLTVPQTHTNHKAGTIVFGADGDLYVAVGDGGTADPTAGGDPNGHGQNTNTLLGSILRINPTTGAPYTAAGNYPGGLPEIWDIGLRNPFRMSFDGCTGDLYIGDVGQEVKEEINVERSGEGHKNYGWNTMEGTTCFNAANKSMPLGTCDQTGLASPIIDYDTSGGAAVISGAVYRGTEIPWLRGTYLHGDQVKNTIDSFVYNRDAQSISGSMSHTGTISPEAGVVTINTGNDGELYFVTMGNLMDTTPTGKLWKITAL